MPQAIPAIAIGIQVGLKYGIVYGIIAGAITFAANYVLSSLAEPDFPSLPTGTTQMVRQPVVSRKIVYGERRVSGPLVFIESTGTDNKFLHLIVVLGTAGPYEEIGDVWLNEDVIRSSDLDANGDVAAGSPALSESAEKYSGLVRIKKYVGRHDQVADADLVSETSADINFNLGGCCYLYVRLQFDRDVFPSIPNISAVVKGRKIYDPGNGAHDADDPETWEYSANSALVLLDYVRGVPAKVASGAVKRIHGIAAQDDNIDMTVAANAAVVCDEQVETGTGSPSEFENRYETHAVIDTADKPVDIINNLRASMAGAIVYSDGTWRILAGEYRAHSVTLTQDDFRGSPKVKTRIGRRSLFNAVKGVFVSPVHNWQRTDYPAVTSATYESEDNGVRIWKDINFPYTTSNGTAQRLAKIALQRVRRQISVELACKLTAFRVRAGDTVALTYDRFGWDAKTFEVVGWQLTTEADEDNAPYIGVDLQLREIDSAVFDWDVSEEQPPVAAPQTNLPDPFSLAAPMGLTLESGTDQLFVAGDGTVISQIKATWTAAADGFVEQYEIQFKKSVDANWTSRILDASITEYFVTPVEDGTDYDFRVRSIAGVGSRSEWESVFAHTVVGKTEVPPNVDTFTVTRLADGTRKFMWTLNVPPADVRAGGGYKIRYASGSETDWSVMSALHDGVLVSSPYETNDLSAGDYTFAVKAVDSSGNESTTALFIEATLGDPRLEEVILSRLEHELGFPGTKTNCFVDDDGILKSTSTGGWDDIAEGSPQGWDDLPDTWDAIMSQNSPITYETPEIDLGAEATFTPLVTVTGAGTATVTMRSGGDGSPQIETSYGALGTVSARYVQIKVEVTGTAPTIREMSILLDGQTKTVDREDVDTSSETAEWFESLAAGHFRVRGEEQASITVAQITAIQNVGPGWTWELISKNADLGSPDEGPAAEFKVYNGSGTLADATVDVTLKGPKT